jgi:ABC-2 type transport system permease protein
MNKKKNIQNIFIVFFFILFVNLIFTTYFFRLDLTTDKRYSVSKNSKKLFRDLKEDLSVIIYLDGDLNPGFLRLKKSTIEMLEEFRVYAGNKISYSFQNPSSALANEDRIKQYEQMEKRGMRATVVYEKDAEGQSKQKVIFPWAQIIKGKDTINVNLLKNIPGNSGQENLNISIENIEFELTDAVRILTSKEVQKIAFLEGHGELPEMLTYDITHSLSKYFQIDRGVLGDDPSVLDLYKAVVVAKPQDKFSETEKYIIDQYIMRGGRVLWLVDGARVSMDTLATYGVTPAIQNDVNLNDQLFRYGVRINANLIQDVQCAYIPVDKAREGEAPNYQPAPWYFSPLLFPVPSHSVSRNLNAIKGEFSSTVDFVGNDSELKKHILLVSSQNYKVLNVPIRVGLEVLNMPADPAYFNERYHPVAVALEGTFQSVFKNRIPPKNLLLKEELRESSEKTRMIVIADGDVIRNEVTGVGANVQPLPLGYDSYMNQEFGNRQFIMNAILYLTDDDGWLNLRSRELKLRLLDKVAVLKNKRIIQVINVLLPLLVLLVFYLFNFVRRRSKYTI